MHFDSKLPNITASIFSVMGQMAVKHNAINLSQGFPNFPSDPKLIALVNQAMEDGYNQYAPMEGVMGLRKEIATMISELHHRQYDPEAEITITAGATQAIFTALACSIEKNDEAIILTPAYDCYAPTIELFGGKVVPIQLAPPEYSVAWDRVAQAVTPATKMIIVNNPHNPSGKLFSENDMKQLTDIAVRHNLLVLSDEVYEHIVFDGQQHLSAARFEGLAERSFITASFGKTFHNTGWKMGYCVAPKVLMDEFRKVHQFNVFCVNHPIQKALAAYLKDPENYRQLSQFYQQKRDLFLDLIRDSGFKAIPSGGTYFQLLDYSDISDIGDIEFAERLLKTHGVATIPTSVFNEGQRDYKQIRVCFAKTEETLAAAAKILNKLTRDTF